MDRYPGELIKMLLHSPHFSVRVEERVLCPGHGLLFGGSDVSQRLMCSSAGIQNGTSQVPSLLPKTW